MIDAEVVCFLPTQEVRDEDLEHTPTAAYLTVEDVVETIEYEEKSKNFVSNPLYTTFSFPTGIHFLVA